MTINIHLGISWSRSLGKLYLKVEMEYIPYKEVESCLFHLIIPFRNYFIKKIWFYFCIAYFKSWFKLLTRNFCKTNWPFIKNNFYSPYLTVFLTCLLLLNYWSWYQIINTYISWAKTHLRVPDETSYHVKLGTCGKLFWVSV